jgi:hypothetical protein
MRHDTINGIPLVPLSPLFFCWCPLVINQSPNSVPIPPGEGGMGGRGEDMRRGWGGEEWTGEAKMGIGWGWKRG